MEYREKTLVLSFLSWSVQNEYITRQKLAISFVIKIVTFVYCTIQKLPAQIIFKNNSENFKNLCKIVIG